jgi:hypothetical protein
MGYGPPMGMPGVGSNQPAEELAKSSKLTFTQRGSSVDMKLDLVFDPSGYARLNSLVGLLALHLKSEVDLAGGAHSRHDLALAVKILGERGLSERGVAPGRYPQAALKRTGNTRLEQQPYHRMSWLTGLLPYMGHDALYQKIDFDASWQDPKNWLAARTIVPQFLDPQYPDAARFSTPPDVGVEMAATHVVGIAGVGLDAADYPRNDPAFDTKRGVFSYDGSASLEEIRGGRGLSNTAVAIQIPHDGPTGVSPFIAGGGATVRGVPEKNSIAPFVLSTDRNGKPIQYNGKRGTYVTMADGSVRFVTANVSDQVFQAMCTVKGPAPKEFDLFKNPDTPLIPKAKVEEKKATTDRSPAAGEKTPAVTTPTALPAGWNTYKVPGDGFSISLPPNPKMLEQAVFQGGPTVKLLIAVDTTTQNLYVVTQIPLDANAQAEFSSNPDQTMRDFAAKLSGLTGQAIPEKEVTQSGLKGKQFTVTGAKGGKTLVLRIFPMNNYVAIMQATSDDATPPRHAQAFFESFRTNNYTPPQGAIGLTPEGKAFHEGVVKFQQDVKALETKYVAELLKIKDVTQLQSHVESEYRELMPILQAARKLKAPTGKAGPAYHAALIAYVDFLEKNEKQALDLLQRRPPDLAEQMKRFIAEAPQQNQQMIARLTSAQQTFLDAHAAK